MTRYMNNRDSYLVVIIPIILCYICALLGTCSYIFGQVTGLYVAAGLNFIIMPAASYYRFFEYIYECTYIKPQPPLYPTYYNTNDLMKVADSY